MTATIEDSNGTRATIDNDVITSEDRALVLVLRQLLLSIDPLRYVPDADREIASAYVRLFGGRIVESDGPGTEGDPPGVVY